MFDPKKIHRGMKVESSDGKSLGKVSSRSEDGFVIEKGFFFPKNYLVSDRDVRDLEGDTIHLGLTGDQLSRAAEAGWQQEPKRQPESKEYVTEERTRGREPLEREERSIPLAEERLETERRSRETGAVKVHKDVKTEHRRVDVPVSKEEVRVERVPSTGGERSAEGRAFREETARIPVREEEVEVKKRPVVKEEVRLSKESHEKMEPTEVEVRREEARVEEEGGTERKVHKK